MPKTNDSFTTTLKLAHLEWGIHRYTKTRDRIYGEGYLQIPRSIATSLNILNSNQNSQPIEFECNSKDGFIKNETLKASGSSKAGDKYAKQFQGSGNLKILGKWFEEIGAQEGDQVKVTWLNPTKIEIEKL